MLAPNFFKYEAWPGVLLTAILFSFLKLSNSNLFIKFPSSIDNVSVSVYNILGVLVYKNQLESMKPIHIETFSNGLYVLTIYVDNKKTMTFKFIKK